MVPTPQPEIHSPVRVVETPKELLILVTGTPGSGKSFLRGPADSHLHRVPDSRYPYPNDVIQTSSFNIGNLRIVLLETPGVTDENIISTTSLLRNFLSNSFPGKTLSGVIYIHRIDSESPSPSLASTTLRAFRPFLPGGETGVDHSRICMVTNFWGSPPTPTDRIKERRFIGVRGRWTGLRRAGARYRRLKCYDMPRDHRAADYAVAEIISVVVDRATQEDSVDLGGQGGGDSSNGVDTEGINLVEGSPAIVPPTRPSPTREYNPLWNAVATGDMGGVRRILDDSTNGHNMVDWRGEFGSMALMKAVEDNNLGIAKTLLKAGAGSASINDTSGTTALHLASSLGFNKIVKCILKYASDKEGINARDNEGNTPLHLACINRHDRCVKTLLKNGADVSIADGTGRPPLYHAVVNGDWEIVRRLIKAGARTDEGWVDDLHLQLDRGMLMRLAQPTSVLHVYKTSPYWHVDMQVPRTGFLCALPIIFQILIEQSLAARFRWPWRAKRAPVVINSKIGTLDQYLERYVIFVEKGYRKDKKLEGRAVEALRKVAAPPKVLNVYTLESVYLGCVAFTVTMQVNSSELAWRTRRKFGRGLLDPVKVFSGTDENLLESSWSERAKTVPWLNGDVEPSSRRSSSGRIDGPSQIPSGLQLRSTGDKGTDQAATETGQLQAVANTESGQLSEMRMLSQPPEPGEAGLEDSFWNYESAGDGQVVYIIDTGLDPTVQELRDVIFDDIISTGPFPTDEKGMGMTTKWHGTIVTSKVAGKITGAAQKAKIVFIETGDGRSIDTFEPEGWIDGLLRIYDHIKSVNNGKNCIVNISFGFGLGFFEVLWAANPRFTIADGIRSYFWDSLLYVLGEITRLPNVIVVSSAGNGPRVSILESKFILENGLANNLVE
ncbi:hypothetical protein TWF718_009262 [Orbilia javanica]|uniref:Peptidase S8/S53 domain-containing protein n=1 Tax=Orbilia javanica TaxID=47235 RepID=A0AAN8MVJ5_9PEZI